MENETACANTSVVRKRFPNVFKTLSDTAGQAPLILLLEGSRVATLLDLSLLGTERFLETL